MTNIVVLNNTEHRGLRVQPLGAEKRNFIGVIVNEFSHLALHYPILFSKDADTGTFYCGAMLGFDLEENLFAADGAKVYRPLNLQRGPFFAAGTELAIDLDSPSVGSGEALFEASGEPTAYLKSMLGLFRDLVPGIERTRIFTETLLGLKLIEPIDIKVSFDDGSARSLAGLYTINREALRELPDAEVLNLFRRGYLELIYLMTASLKQVSILANKKNSRLLEGVTGLS
ncbi:MAG: SapC family protein [Rhizomicrobium sp.]|nr:SapC family protein [Rhizomicrobium sp.]